jgi:hypothetical protein
MVEGLECAAPLTPSPKATARTPSRARGRDPPLPHAGEEDIWADFLSRARERWHHAVMTERGSASRRFENKMEGCSRPCSKPACSIREDVVCSAQSPTLKRRDFCRNFTKPMVSPTFHRGSLAGFALAEAHGQGCQRAMSWTYVKPARVATAQRQQES